MKSGAEVLSPGKELRLAVSMVLELSLSEDINT